jgi:hypothetical protein
MANKTREQLDREFLEACGDGWEIVGRAAITPDGHVTYEEVKPSVESEESGSENDCLTCGHLESEHSPTKVRECKHGDGCDCFEYDYGQFDKVIL